MRLLYCGNGWLPIVDHIARRLNGSIRVWNRARPLTEEVVEVDVLLPSNAAITADVIAAAKSLRLIQQPAAGIEGVDRAAAVARGIPICNAPGTNHIAVAELALYLLLALARRVKQAPLGQIGVPLGIELAGKTLGIIGMGNSGTALADRAKAMGMTVVALGRDGDRMAFFAQCDAISIHCPLTPETRGMIDDAAFKAMRRGALLVNCSRGGVIDREALIANLDRMGGVGLDVLWNEPGDPDDPLFADPRVIALPHIAGSTEEAFTRITDVVIENIARLERGEPLLHRLA